MINELRELMAKENIDWFVVFTEDPHLSEYTGECDKYREALSGFTGSAGTLAVGESEAYLWTDSRYFVQAESELAGSGITLKKYGLPGVESFESFLADHIWDGQTVAFDHMTLSYSRYREIRNKLPRSVDIIDGRKLLREAVSMPPRAFGRVESVPLTFSGRDISDKLSALCDKIEQDYIREDSYTYILSDLTSIMWLYNLRGCDIRYVPVAYSYALVTKYSATLFVSLSNLTDEAREMLTDNGVAVREYPEFIHELDEIATDRVIADPHNNNSRILARFDENHMLTECSDAQLITKPVKTAAETDGMINAHLKDAVIMIRFIKKVKEMAKDGCLPDEYELGKMLDDMRLAGGCSSFSFETICAYAHNSAIVHYTAGKDTAAKLSSRGFLLVDSGGQYRFEGTTDITRTISLGDVTDEEKKIYTTVLKGNLRLMNMTFPDGVKGSLLDAVAETPIWEIGEFCGHGIGHGVGAYLSVHESEAVISRRSGERDASFVPGVIVSDEPGIYLEGRFGVRLENLLLTERAEDAHGYKMCRFTPLSLVPFDTESIDLSALSDEELEILSHYNSLIEEKVFPLLDENEREWAKSYMILR